MLREIVLLAILTGFAIVNEIINEDIKTEKIENDTRVNMQWIYGNF